MNTIGAVSQVASMEPTNKKKIEDSAQDFESMLVAQMLRNMREASSGWLGTGDDTSATPAMEMAEESFAKSISASGGLGLAKMVSKSLKEQKG